MVEDQNLDAIFRDRLSSCVIPCSQFIELCSRMKAAGGDVLGMEFGHKVSLGTDKAGRKRSKRDPSGYTVYLRHAEVTERQELMPWEK
jgi:hypothetical protein